MIDIQNQQYGRAFLDAFGFGMNIYGIITWTKEEKAKIKEAEVETNE